MSVPWRLVVRQNVMSAKATTGVWNTIKVSDFRHIIVSIATASSANLTVKAQWAIGTMTNESAPTFSSAQSATNMWDYVKMVDLNSGSTIAWDTWFSVTWTDDFKLYEINVNALDYINFEVTARSAGNVTIDVLCANNV